MQDLFCSGALPVNESFAVVLALVYVIEYVLGKTKLVKANSTIELVINLITNLIKMMGTKKE